MANHGNKFENIIATTERIVFQLNMKTRIPYYAIFSFNVNFKTDFVNWAKEQDISIKEFSTSRIIENYDYTPYDITLVYYDANDNWKSDTFITFVHERELAVHIKLLYSEDPNYLGEYIPENSK